MKRKQLKAVGILSICLLAFGCGSNTTGTEQATEDIVAVQTTEPQGIETQGTETQETETQEAEAQETETQETADNVEENENYDNYEELVSVPVDGRDGSIENPYQVGDTIYFPKVVVGRENDFDTAIFSPLTVVVEEATSEYVKISYKFGVDDWNDLNINNWYDPCVDMQTTLLVMREDSDLNQIGSQLNIYNSLNDVDDLILFGGDSTKVTLYYQEYTGGSCIEDTAYLMLIYSKFSIPVEECYPLFNCTFIEVPNL